ncbi:DUF2341 domain-containing protein [Paenibacillus sp. PAMC21692]|uniref:DUF2341 domain-containing protein n=1 Tax=Paenibacillus sp. PAMC21692 TaxID=2762320 RepID=UPI00164D8274|nr:DUF2341 domain-containing protein [Paenibacillus sp. PAMC21692]QNK59241.1 DUF2341 domain-containing protein [Paenibacillus sp. PAMC21692]
MRRERLLRKGFRKLQFYISIGMILALAIPQLAMASGQPEEADLYNGYGPGLIASTAGFANKDANPELGQLSGFGNSGRMELDYQYRSIGVDFGAIAAVNTIELEAANASNRVEKSDLSLYISSDNETYSKVKDWDFVKVDNRVILYNFSESARYVKVHNHFDDTKGTFYNESLQEMIKAYQLPQGRWTAGNGQSWLYQKPVTVSNSNAEMINDRAVYLTKEDLGTAQLIVDGKLQADYRDIRFAAGGQELHFYMDDAGFYVRIPEMQPEETKQIYMYYGNPAASFRGGAQEALQIEYGNKTIAEQSGELKPVRLKDGTLMTVAGSNDVGILANYSFDGGKTWTDQETIIQPVSAAGSDLYEFPTGTYVDPDTGEVYLFFAVHHYFGVWSGGNTCLSIDVCRNDMYVVKSTGFDGQKPVFGEPARITGLQTASGAPIHYMISYTNPIRHSSGRIIAPFSHVIGDDGTFGVSFLYSDDNGGTWQKSVSELTIPSIGGEGGVTEVAIIELADGSLKTYLRQQRSDIYYLGTSSSADEGLTWSPVADSEMMSTNTFPAMQRDDNGNILLTWSGHNAEGMGSYYRNNLTIAYSDDETLTWQGYHDLTGRTRLSTPGWISENEKRNVVQADGVKAGDDARLFTWPGLTGAFSMLVEDFDRYLRYSHGALDSFEYEHSGITPDNGTSLANDYWWKTANSGVVTTSDAVAKQGDRSLYIHDNIDDQRVTGGSRLFPATRKASVQLSVYGESFDNDLFISLQEGYSQHWNALGAGFILQLDSDGSLKYTDTEINSSTGTVKVGFVNPDSNPLTGNLSNFSDAFPFALDYKDRSVGVDLGRAAKLREIHLIDGKQYNKPQPPDNLPGNRIQQQNLEVYVSDMNNGDWTLLEGWTFEKEDGNINIGLEHLDIEARYVKVHQNYSDTAFTFGAPQQEIMRVITEYDQPIEFHELATPTSLTFNEWHKIRLDFDLDSGMADVYVNDAYKGPIEAAHPGKVVNHLMISSGASGLGTEVYIDEVMIQDLSVALPQAGLIGDEEAAVEETDTTAPAILFSPDGSETLLYEASVQAAVTDDWSGIDADRLMYVWAQSETAPDTGWKAFGLSDAITLSSVSGDWYLHIRAVDMNGNEAQAHSNRFRMQLRESSGSTAPSTGGNTANEWNIAAGEGGTLSSNNEIELTIPAGASDGAMRIAISKLQETGVLQHPEWSRLSPAFKVSKNVAGSLKKPATIKLKFDREKLEDHQLPVIAYYDEEKKVWVEIGGKVEGDFISAATDRLATFAVFAKLLGSTEPAVSFSDLAGHWSQAAVYEAVRLGIVNGYPNGMFKPDKELTRAEFIVMLARALELEANEEALPLSFADSEHIPDWALLSIAQALQSNIIQGYDDGTFRPDARITRTEMIVMTVRALGLSVGMESATSFADDAAIPAWAKPLVAEAAARGLVEGRGGNRFAPEGESTRAEAVKVLLKAIQ